MLKCLNCDQPLTRYKKKWCSNKCAAQGGRDYVRRNKKTDKQMRPILTWLWGLYSNKQLSPSQFAERVNEVVK